MSKHKPSKNVYLHKIVSVLQYIMLSQILLAVLIYIMKPIDYYKNHVIHVT
jgi:hypothetical protein